MHGWECVRLVEDGTTIAQGTTGLRTWEARCVLRSCQVARWRLTRPPSLRLGAHFLARPPPTDARILELGAGAGLLGAIAARLCPAHVTLTDLEGPVLDRLRSTVALNGAAAQVGALDWCDVDEELLRAAHADVVLAADVVFDPSLIAPLAHTLRRALELGAEHAYALVAVTESNASTYKRFLAALAEAQLDVQPQTLQEPALPPDAPPLPLFPSAHEPLRDGPVRLLALRLHAR
jgi:predicted nicotinamide N-methyase